MNQSAKYLVLLMFISLLFIVFGCFSGAHHGTVGTPLDAQKITEIEPGVTTLTQVLHILGPPNLIVDGSQPVLNYDIAIINQGCYCFEDYYPPRTLTSPEGTVILLYQYSEMSGNMKGAAFPVGVHVDADFACRSNELLVFISKKEHVVTEIVTGLPMTD